MDYQLKIKPLIITYFEPDVIAVRGSYDPALMPNNASHPEIRMARAKKSNEGSIAA